MGKIGVQPIRNANNATIKKMVKSVKSLNHDWDVMFKGFRVWFS